MTTAHFKVWYDSNPNATDYITQTQASDLAAMAENAYAAETGWGYAAPVDDGDGKVDISVIDFSANWPAYSGFAISDGASAPSSGSIDLATSVIGTSSEQHTIAHELFHLIQFRQWVPASQPDHWLLEESAEWAGYSVDGYLGAASIGPGEISLDCFDAVFGNQRCSSDGYVNGAYSRWPFFQVLADAYGSLFANSILANAGAGQAPLTALSNALAAKGTTLTNVFTTYVTDVMDGGLGVSALSSSRPAAFMNVPTGTTSQSLGSLSVPVDHLAARYVTFQRGGDGSHACYAATLSITVTMPSDTSSRPYFFWDNTGSTPVALNVNGNTASTTVPWDTCAWGKKQFGWLSLPNASTTVDAATFTVASSVTVDTNTPATAASAPPATTIWGTPVPVPTTDVAPLIDVFGPELLTLSASNPTIRLIVSSSGVGSVNATLGAKTLGSRSLRAGSNDLRFVVPKGLLTSLRRSALAENLLTLTPMSTSGQAIGQPVTRRVTIAHASKTKKLKSPKK